MSSAARYWSLPPDDLRIVISNGARIAKNNRVPVWSLVSDLFGVGSTSGKALAARAGLDPDGPASIRPLAKLPPSPTDGVGAP